MGCDFLLLQAFQVRSKWNQEEKRRKNKKTSKFLLVGKLIFMFFMTNALIFLNGCEISGI